MNTAKSQSKNPSTGAAVAGCVIGGGFIGTYFVMNKNAEKDYLVQPVSRSTKRRIQQQNSPFLITGIGCVAIGLITYIQDSPITLKVGKNTTAGIMGSGVGISYAIK